MLYKFLYTLFQIGIVHILREILTKHMTLLLQKMKDFEKCVIPMFQSNSVCTLTTTVLPSYNITKNKCSYRSNFVKILRSIVMAATAFKKQILRKLRRTLRVRTF